VRIGEATASAAHDLYQRGERSARHGVGYAGHGAAGGERYGGIDIGHRRARASMCSRRGQPRGEVERQRLEAGAGDDRRSAALGRRLVPIDHLGDPVDLAGEVELMDAGTGAGAVHRLAVAGVRTDEVGHDTAPLDQRINGCRIGDIGQHHPVGPSAHVPEDGIDPVSVPASHRPRQPELRRATGEVAGHLASGDAGWTEKDHIEECCHDLARSAFGRAHHMRATDGQPRAGIGPGATPSKCRWGCPIARRTGCPRPPDLTGGPSQPR